MTGIVVCINGGPGQKSQNGRTQFLNSLILEHFIEPLKKTHCALGQCFKNLKTNHNAPHQHLKPISVL